MSAQNARLDFLPAGEWRDIKIVGNARGMMAGRFAVMARAKWLRDGGRPAFIKYIEPATASAGPSTQSMVGGDRLDRIAERLRLVAHPDSKVPIVPLLEVRLVEETGGLLIAMEDVRPLQDVIAEGKTNVGTAIAVLEALDPEKSAIEWAHYDICPANLAVRANGEIVAIDVESVYLVGNDASSFDISMPGWKRFRAPLPLVLELDEARAVSQAVPAALVRKKHTYEVLMAATECVLGPLNPRGNWLTIEHVRTWCRGREQEPAVQVLLNGITRAFTANQVPPKLGDVAAELRRVQNVASVPEKTLPNAPPMVPMEKSLITPELDEQAAALRAGALSAAEIAKYRDRLLEELKTAKDRLVIWKELLLIAISFEKDPRRAKMFVEEARKEFHDDAELERLQRIILTWGAGQQ